MSIPANGTFSNGIAVISGDELNTFVQGDQTAAQLRSFVGQSGMSVFLQGITTPLDGYAGMFAWISGTGYVDDNLNTIVPSSSSGAWLRTTLYGGGTGAVSAGTANQLGYYAATGSTISGLTLGSGLSISSGILNVTAGGGNVSNSGTPTSGQLAQWTSSNTIQGITTGTGVATALGVNTGSSGAFVVNGGALGTPSSAVLTNATGLPVGGINATGTPSSTTYLRGDGTWSTPSGGGTVNSGTSGQVAYYASNGTAVSGEAPGALSVLATGSTTTRTLATRAADIFNVLDWGFDRTGVADNSSQFSVIVAAIPSTGGTIYFPAGTYKFNSNVYAAGLTVIEMDGGTLFTGSGRLNTDADTSVMVGEQAGKTFQFLGAGDSNTWATYISSVVPSTSGTASYEKGAIYANVTTYDVSAATGTPAYTKDVVAIQASASVAVGNTQGRVWGGAFSAFGSTSSQGALTGVEIDVTNNTGTDASVPATSDPYYKVGVNAVAMGSNKSGTAYQAVGNGTSWRSAFASAQGFVSDYFLLYMTSGFTPLTYIKADGSGTFGAQLTATTVGVTSAVSNTQWATQGSYIGWNYASGTGEMDFVNSHGGGGGGFNWYNVASSSGATPSLLASLSYAGVFTPASAVALPGSASGTLTQQAAASTTSYTLVYPATIGSAGQALEISSVAGSTANLAWATPSGTGTVTSVAVSGGTTGLTTSGGPITGSGTITLAGTLAVANGGTGGTTSTGSGAVVLATSPTLVTPILGVAIATSYTATGSITGSATTGAFNYGTLGYSDVNIYAQFSSSVNSYAQLIIANSSSGTTASADVVISNNLGTATTYYGNIGMNSSGFSGSGSFNLPNAVYLSATSGDLVVGTTTANNIRFVTNGSATDALTINTSGEVLVSASSGTVGNLKGVLIRGWDSGAVVTAGSYVMCFYAPVALTIASMYAQVIAPSTGCSFPVSVYIGTFGSGTVVTGLSSITVNNTATTTNATAANSVSAGQCVYIVIGTVTGTSSNVVVQLNTVRT